MHTVHTEEYKGYTIKISPDMDAMNPREWDNLGTMTCWHRRYNLGDKHDYREPDDFILSFVPDNAPCTESMSLNELIEKYVRPKAIILPLYLYDHSGITMNTTGFHCPWDSGQVGFIHVMLDKVRQEWGVKRTSQKLRQQIEDSLKAEVSTYDDYLRGNVYGYEVEKNGEHIDSCWGFIGDYEDYCLSEARSAADCAEREALPLLNRAGLLT